MKSTMNTSFEKILFSLLLTALFTSACQKGLSESDVQTQVAATVTALVPTETPIPPTKTARPTKISTSTITPTLPPLGLDTLKYYVSKTVEVSGYLCLPDTMLTSQYTSEYTIYLVEDPQLCIDSNEEHYNIKIPIGSENNQMQKLPSFYSSYNLIIRDDDGNIIQGEVYVTIKGRVSGSGGTDYYKIIYPVFNP